MISVALPIRSVLKLQQVRNPSARLLTGVKNYQHVFPSLAVLHQLAVCFHIDFKVMKLTYKGLNSLGPRYLVERLLLTRTFCHTHSSQTG